jgi:hypothetical protein
MKLFKKKSPLNYLDMIPVRNISEFVKEDTKITLLIPKFKREWMRRFFIPHGKSKHIRLHLDENGTKVWELIDGINSVRVICDQLGKTETPDESIDLKVTKYLSQLYKSRFIIFKK